MSPTSWVILPWDIAVIPVIRRHPFDPVPPSPPKKSYSRIVNKKVASPATNCHIRLGREEKCKGPVEE